MTDTLIIETVVFCGSLVAILVPLLRGLNSYTARLERVVEKIEEIEKRYDEQNAEIKARVTAHGKAIDELNIKSAQHDVRLREMEKKR